jgi:hypothetical protein
MSERITTELVEVAGAGGGGKERITLAVVDVAHASADPPARLTTILVEVAFKPSKGYSYAYILG